MKMSVYTSILSKLHGVDVCLLSNDESRRFDGSHNQNEAMHRFGLNVTLFSFLCARLQTGEKTTNKTVRGKMEAQVPMLQCTCLISFGMIA